MKKNSLIVIASLFLGALSISSCKNDASLSDKLKGRYDVKVTDINLKELEDASLQAREELEKGKKELQENLEKAQAEIDQEVNIEIDGKKADLKGLIGNVGKGLEKVMEGLGEMGSGLGQGITELVVKNTTFQVDFRDNGVLAIGSNNDKFNFSSKNLTWKIENERLIIKDRDNNKEDFSFELKAPNNTDWELINEKIKLSLCKIK